MVLQDKYKAKASRAWKSSRGLSTATRPNRRPPPPPPTLTDEVAFPELQKQDVPIDSGSGSGSGSDTGDDSQDESNSAGGVAVAASITSNIAARRSQHPKFSRRRLVNNSSRYDEPDDEGEEGHSSNEDYDMSTFMTKSANVDDDVGQYSTQKAVNIDEGDIDYDLANRDRNNNRQVLQMDTQSTKELREMHKDRINAEAGWNLKSRLRGESGRQYIQRYESSKKTSDQSNDNHFFDSISNTPALIGIQTNNKDDKVIPEANESSTVVPQGIAEDQDFLDNLI
ncbi:hypothetical protein E3P89_01262 [Wallemia ichthyophaga]|uniref:Uncharacterized protein n=1 Tax=Wallemia ichthyophaga TaxID=245174 RepID=A0A4T0FTG9_WALIC|nr:hypothetical protein E3P97_01727 [Wallemia ichthyophaga]TIB02042.1 hypothetical protein E3P95_01133 [Wallemia ichthyophaga]TIB02917.1 hypothetical protein E3P94_01265 [Wallemia ichthyophaga]TIB13480.1 hypothetical protein E3P90_01662 [Wallemia ichthyophaga]TIB15257.1 hypothetical protein E3P93_01412 [Wallemia ichthyophaga]